jgi:hypothetical protein
MGSGAERDALTRDQQVDALAEVPLPLPLVVVVLMVAAAVRDDGGDGGSTTPSTTACARTALFAAAAAAAVVVVMIIVCAASCSPLPGWCSRRGSRRCCCCCCCYFFRGGRKRAARKGAVGLVPRPLRRKLVRRIPVVVSFAFVLGHDSPRRRRRVCRPEDSLADPRELQQERIALLLLLLLLRCSTLATAAGHGGEVRPDPGGVSEGPAPVASVERRQSRRQRRPYVVDGMRKVAGR